MNYTLRVFHPDGHYKNRRNYNHLQSDYDGDTCYDHFEVKNNRNPIKEIIYWNRIYKMQNGRLPVMPQRIEKWECGECTVIPFNPLVFKITNWILTKLPKSIRIYRRNWNYVKFFGM